MISRSALPIKKIIVELSAFGIEIYLSKILIQTTCPVLTGLYKSTDRAIAVTTILALASASALVKVFGLSFKKAISPESLDGSSTYLP